MSHRRRARTVALTAAVTVLGTLSLRVATPALAIDATFAVTPGPLSVTVPTDTARLGSVESSITDQTVSGPLGSVTITDNRGGKDTTWSALVSASDFAAGGEVVSASSVDYQSVIAKLSGPGSVGAKVVANSLADISNPKQAIVATGLHGNNATTWNPTIKVRVPAQTLSGVYSGIITHSVA